MSIGRWLIPQNAIRPARLPGPTRWRPVDSPVQIPQATADCHTRAIAPIRVAAHRGIRRACEITAVDTNTAPTIAPKIAPLAAQAAREPSNSVATSWPSTAALRPSPKTIDLIRCEIGRSITISRETGASRTWRMSANSIEIGPPSAPLRRPRANARTTSIPMTDGPRASRSSVSTPSPTTPVIASDAMTTAVNPSRAKR
ncbi:MAG: hypothetical protein DRJ50_11565 [Actinobacteria bacterium]|nr:MAG: hypothetical protein DRJ50_11565 [Actinomycetota bacterium]